MAGELPILPITATKLALQFQLPVLTSLEPEFNCQSGVWVSPGKGRSGYYCRRTSFDKGRSDDYVGYTPRTDDNCPVIQPGQAPNGYCSCMKIILDY